MEFITVKSLGGSIWSFRKDRIEMVSNRFKFDKEEVDNLILSQRITTGIDCSSIYITRTRNCFTINFNACRLFRP